MTTRQEKVNSLLQREIGAYLQRAAFEGITGLLTITAVDTDADLEHAKIFFSVVGQDPPPVLQILQAHIYEIQGVLYQELQMRKVPRIKFVSDVSGQHADRIEKLIKEIRHGQENH